MRTLCVLLFTVMSANAQRFTFESHALGPDPSKTPLGSVKEEPAVWRFVSEDGKVEFTYPRTDLVRPSVKITAAGDVYTYVVTNGKDAKANIDTIQFAAHGEEAEEISTPPGFGFVGSGWISEEAAGIAPGHSATFKVRQKQFSPQMVFRNFEFTAQELPDEAPYGLLVLYRQWMGSHGFVYVTAAVK